MASGNGNIRCTDLAGAHAWSGMTRTAVALATCIALSGCARPAADAAPVTTSPATDAPAGAARPATDTAAAAATYDFLLLPRGGKPVQDPRVVETIADHPCGPIGLVRVASIPLDDPVFMPAFVVEFDAAGKELGKWGIPSEAEVNALDGSRLQFETDAGSFWVSPDGALEKTEAVPDAATFRTAENMFDCPALPTFAEPGALQCFRVRDAAGAERRIAMEGSCN